MVHALSPCVALASDEPLALGGGQHSEDLGEGDSYSSDSADAEWLYRDALAQQPGDAIALGALADVLYRKGNVEGAVRCFESALASNPSSRSTLLSYGLLLLGRSGEGDADKAAELLGRAVQVDPTCVPAMYMYGRLLHAVCGRLADAEDMYRQALSFEPARGDILNDYGALLEAQGGADDVVRGMYKRAAMLAPDNADALSNHARVLEEAGGGSDSKDDSAPAAVALYRRALDARPQHVPTLCNLAQTLAAMRGRVTPEAKDLMQRALALEPRDVGALCQYARFLQEEAAATRGDVDAEGEAAALGLYHDALALDPQRIEALNGIGTICERRAQQVWAGSNHGDEAADREKEALLAKAESMYARALGISPLHADTLCNRGALLSCHRGRPGHAEAEHLYRKALSVVPNHAAALYNFGFLRQCQNSMPEAMALYERAYEQDPARLEIREALAGFSASKYANDFVGNSSPVDPVAAQTCAEARWSAQYADGPGGDELRDAGAGVKVEAKGGEDLVDPEAEVLGKGAEGFEAIQIEKAREAQDPKVQARRRRWESKRALDQERIQADEREALAELLRRGGADVNRSVSHRFGAAGSEAAGHGHPVATKHRVTFDVGKAVAEGKATQTQMAQVRRTEAVKWGGGWVSRNLGGNAGDDRNVGLNEGTRGMSPSQESECMVPGILDAMLEAREKASAGEALKTQQLDVMLQMYATR